MPRIARDRPHRPMTLLAGARRRIQQMGPYRSLVLMLTPLLLVEPLKLVALVIAGKGHMLTGTAVLCGAYAVSLMFVERLFRVVKPKLMTLGWFADIWARYCSMRNKTYEWVGIPTETEGRIRTISSEPHVISSAPIAPSRPDGVER